MKKRSGAMLVLAVGTIFVLCYSFTGKQPMKQSAYNFFNSHEPDKSPVISGSNKVDSSHAEVKRIQSNLKKKPHFVDFEGLDYLYARKNISKEESKALLVWGKIRSLLSRSDALPETAQAIKEAAFAWKELLYTIEKDKVSKFPLNRNSSNVMERRDCPYSISVFNSTMYRNGNVLQIPCGLVEDSSITVIGIPDGHGVRFQIDLVGSQFSDEGIPPVILHYNVCMPGDNLTEEPMIVQNTWSNELGWGKKERCPGYGSSTAQKVDGLVKCNEQVIRRTAGGNLNASHPDSNKLTNVSIGSAHASDYFPFVDGNPFVATLRVGLEGFHMTVNGRHETSFVYRKKLEPWLVGGVKVAGGLHLISALAKGLPVSEDFDLVIDIEHLKAPRLSSKGLLLLIGIFSTANNFDRRMALRRSWMQYNAVRSGNVAVRFFIGLHKNKEVNFHLWKEAQAYGDIQLMPFVDYYSLLTLKTVAICILGTEILPAKYIMKTDDDAFVRIDEILSSLKGKKVSNGLLYGLLALDSSPHRDRDNKWYISIEEWPHELYPPWAHGPGYIVSKDIARFIVLGHRKRGLPLFKLEDVAVGIWIDQFKRQGHKVHYITDERFHNAGCESNYILAHYQNPRKVLCLWDKLQNDHKPECCEENPEV